MGWGLSREARSDGFGRIRLGFGGIRGAHGVGREKRERIGRERKRERERGPARGSWAGPGPARCARARGCKWAGSGWWPVPLFFNKAFSFFFSLVLKLI